MGIYFLEKGGSQRNSKVIYDRAHSSIATAIYLEACKAAKTKGVKVSCDLNYRKNYGQEKKLAK